MKKSCITLLKYFWSIYEQKVGTLSLVTKYKCYCTYIYRFDTMLVPI